jgi:hypothetical protein
LSIVERGQSSTVREWSFEAFLVTAFLLSLFFFSYGPLRYRIAGSNVFRIDWLLSFLLIVYVGLSTRELSLSWPVVSSHAFLTASAVGILFGAVYNVTDYLTLFVQIGLAVVLFTALANVHLSVSKLRAVLRTVTLFVGILAVYTVYQAIALNLGLPGKSIMGDFVPNYPQYGYLRPTVIFVEPSYLAAGLTNGLAIVFPCAVSGRPILFRQTVQWLLVGVILVGIIISGSFAGIVTLVIGAGTLLLVPTVREFIAKRGVVVAVCFGGLLLLGELAGLSVSTMIIGRVEALLSLLTGGWGKGGGSITVRRARYITSFNVWAVNPLFGVGWGQFGEWVVAHGFDGLIDYTDRVTDLQGAYAQVLAQTGLVGTIPFVAIWVGVVREEFASVVRTEGATQILVSAVLVLTLLNLIDWTYTFSAVHPIRWGMIGIGYGFVRGISGDSHEPQSDTSR